MLQFYLVKSCAGINLNTWPGRGKIYEILYDQFICHGALSIYMMTAWMMFWEGDNHCSTKLK